VAVRDNGRAMGSPTRMHGAWTHEQLVSSLFLVMKSNTGAMHAVRIHLFLDVDFNSIGELRQTKA
jgi:hypothetical protein